MVRPNVPCHGCTKREIGCHAVCEKYRSFKDAMKKFKDHVKMERDVESLSTPKSNKQKRYFK